MTEPRIPLLEVENWSEEARTALARWNPPFNIHKTLAHAPRLMQAWIGFGNHILFQSLLSPKEREIVILRVAWNCRSAYEWGQHARVGRMVGMSDAEIARVPQGAGAEGWTAHEAALITAVDDLQRDWEIGDAAWARLKERYTDEQMIDLVFLVGEFILVAMALKSFRVPPDAGLEPLPEA